MVKTVWLSFSLSMIQQSFPPRAPDWWNHDTSLNDVCSRAELPVREVCLGYLYWIVFFLFFLRVCTGQPRTQDYMK